MLKQIEEKLLSGESISRQEALTLCRLEGAEVAHLSQLADSIKRNFWGNKIDLCSIMAVKVGLCTEDCKYCAQSAHHSCGVQASDLANEREVLERARLMQKNHAHKFSLVSSGNRLTEREFESVLHMYRRLKEETSLRLCASLGSITEDMAFALKQSGVEMYHHNVETARSYFPDICTTHTYDERVETICNVKRAGLKVCSGGIIAMGESVEQRIEMAFELKELDVDSVPVNILNPVPGTAFENVPPVSRDEILKTIAVFRLIMPDKQIRFAGGRERALGEDVKKGYTGGISGDMLGDYLTTPGMCIERHLQLLRELGLNMDRDDEAVLKC